MVARSLFAVGDVHIRQAVPIEVDDRHRRAHRRHLRHDVRQLRIERRSVVDDVEPGGLRGFGQSKTVLREPVRVGGWRGRAGRTCEAADEQRRREQSREDDDEDEPGVAVHGLRTADGASAGTRSASRTGSEVTYLVWYLAKSSGCWR